MSLLAAIENQERLAVGFGRLQEERDEALDRYLGRPYGDEQEGRSQVVMRDVADTVEWIKPSLMKVFASGDEVCQFQPVGPEDEDQAQQETDYINHLLMQKNDGFVILHDWFHDALVQKTGYVMVTYETEQRAEREQFQGLTDDEFALLLQGDGTGKVEVVSHSQRLDEMGNVYHDAIVTKKEEYGCVKVHNIPPERVLVAGDWPGLNLQGCPFVEVIEYCTVSELRQRGFDVEDDINDSSQYSEDLWAEQRRELTFDGTVDREDLEADAATRRLRVRRIWMQFDEDGDGIAELRRLVVVGSTILENEEDDITPVAAISPQRMPHEHHGISITDNVADLQRIRTVLVRGFLDNMYLANNGRNAVDASRVNIDDLMVARPGGVVRVQGDPGSAIFPLMHPQQGPAILQAIEYVDTVRENRTGVTKYNQGLDANSLNKTATGVQQIMSAAQQRIELIARLFAETGVKSLMLIVHAMSLKHTRQAEMMKLRNKWVQVDPRSWKARRDMVVSVGLGTGNKDQMLQHLMMIIQAQQEGLNYGVATPKNLYNALSRLTQNAGFKMPDEFWTNPEDAQPQPPQEDPALSKARMEMEADAQKFQAQTQVERENRMAEAELERERMQMQTELDANRQEYERQQKDREIQMQAEAKAMELQYQERMKAAELEFERWKVEYLADVDMQQEQMRTQVAMQKQADNVRDAVAQVVEEREKAPPKIIRDETGRAVAVERNGVRRNITRDEQGRPIGLE